MSKQLFDGQEQFDGYPVTLYDGRFSGTFELPENVGADLEYDEVITFLVTANVGKAVLDATRLGDLKRTNTLKVTSAVPVAPGKLNSVFDVINYGESADVGVVPSGGLLEDDEPGLLAAVEEEEDVVVLGVTPGPETFEVESLGSDEVEVFSPGQPADPTYWPGEQTGPKSVSVDFTDGPKTDPVLAGFLSEVG